MTRDTQRSQVTQLLLRWRAGEEAALNRLTPLVYEELRRLARAHMRLERADHTLQPTEIVHEAFAKLVNLELSWQDRTHFLSMASRLMRRILVDHARARRSAKRGGDAQRVDVDVLEEGIPSPEPEWNVIELDHALRRLEDIEPRQSRMVECHYFGGLSYEEIAEALEVSPATVGRELRHARAWIRHQLEKEQG